MDENCPHCGNKNCYTHCPMAKYGEHRVEKTPKTAEIYVTDNDSFIVDFRCSLCGQSGAATVKHKDIQWD